MKRFYWIMPFFILTAFIFLSTPITNPADVPDNVWVNIILEDEDGLELLHDKLTDSTEKPITFPVRHYLPDLIESANLSMIFPYGHDLAQQNADFKKEGSDRFTRTGYTTTNKRYHNDLTGMTVALSAGTLGTPGFY